MKILFKVSGSIAAYKVCSVISELVKEGHEVKVAASASALKFIGSATLEALSSNSIFTDDFQPGRRLDHIYLNDWADIVVLAPATAQSLNAMSVGVGSSCLTTLFLSRKKKTPYLIFPAMNPRMWQSSQVKNSVSLISKNLNVHIFNPESGAMACGHVGQGRLLEPYQILQKIDHFNLKNEKVLISLGGTVESIDDVREISNFSTGRTGLDIIKALRSQYSVDVLASYRAKLLLKEEYGFNVEYFSGVLDLEEKFKNKLVNNIYSKVIHLAAVSDYVVLNKKDKKIDSSKDHLQIDMVKAPKILNQIKKWSKNKDVELISFKLTHNQSDQEQSDKIDIQFKLSDSNFIIHNELNKINEKTHEFKIFNNMKDIVAVGKSKEDLSLFFKNDSVNIGRL